jgi:hypothetical protein
MMPSYHTSGFEVMKTLTKDKKLPKEKPTPDDIDKCLSEDKECQTRYLEAFGDCS